MRLFILPLSLSPPLASRRTEHGSSSTASGSHVTRTLLQSIPSAPTAPSTPSPPPRAPHSDLPPVPYYKGNTQNPNLKWYLIGGIAGGGALAIIILIVVCCCVCCCKKDKTPAKGKPPTKYVPKQGEPMSPTLAAAYAAATGIPTSPLREVKSTTSTSASTANTSTTTAAPLSPGAAAMDASSSQNGAVASSSAAVVEPPPTLSIVLDASNASAANTLRALNTGRSKRIHAATPFMPVHVPDSSDDSTTTSEDTEDSSEEESSEEDDSESVDFPLPLPPAPVALESESEDETSDSEESSYSAVPLSARSAKTPAASPPSSQHIGTDPEEPYDMDHVDEEGFDDW